MEHTPERKKRTPGQMVTQYVTKKAEAVKSSQGRGKNLSIRWGDKWWPPQDYTSKIRLLPAEYLGFDGYTYDYFQYVQFRSQRTKRDFVSSKEWKMINGELSAVGGKCLGYDEWMREINDNIPREKRCITMRLMHVVNIIQLDWFHLVPVFDDKTGQPVLYKGGDYQGQQVHRKEQCEGRRCKMCRDGLEKVFGKKGHWSMGAGHLGDVGGFMVEIEKECNYCDDGMLETVAYECEECGHPVIDMETTDLSDAKIRQITSQKCKCPKCGYEDYLIDQFDCDKCQDPVRKTIYDVDIEVKRNGQGTKSTVQIPRWTTTELTDDLLSMATPYKFNEIFNGDPLNIQAKLLKVDNTYDENAGSSSPREHARDYGSSADYGE